MKRSICLLLILIILTGCAAGQEIPAVTDAGTTTAVSASISVTTTATSETNDTTTGLSTGTTASVLTATTTTRGTTTSRTTAKTTTTKTTVKTTTSTTAVSVTPAAEETQAVWVASVINLDFPSASGLSAEALRRECDAILDNVSKMGLNTVYFQVRPCGDALYPSAIFPSSHYVVEQQGDELPLDILAYMVEGAHKAGLKLYAWVNPVRVKRSEEDALCASNPAMVHPDWVVTAADGGVYYNLGLPEVRTLIADGVAEIVKNYAVDGVIFDDYFYPYSSSQGFDDAAAFATYGAGKTLAEFRRASVNQLIRACYNRVKAERAGCQFGVAPFGIRRNSDAGTSGMEGYSRLYCDAEAWIKGGYIDFIEPQLYWARNDKDAPFQKLADYWSKAVGGTEVELRLALAPYRYSEGEYPAGEITAQVTYARTRGHYGGCSLFRYQFLLADPTETTALFK